MDDHDLFSPSLSQSATRQLPEGSRPWRLGSQFYVDRVIDEALVSGGDPPLTQRHIDAALQGFRPSTLEWLATARNSVEFANQGGRYDEVSRFLVSKEARAWKD